MQVNGPANPDICSNTVFHTIPYYPNSLKNLRGCQNIRRCACTKRRLKNGSFLRFKLFVRRTELRSPAFKLGSTPSLQLHAGLRHCIVCRHLNFGPKSQSDISSRVYLHCACTLFCLCHKENQPVCGLTQEIPFVRRVPNRPMWGRPSTSHASSSRSRSQQQQLGSGT